MCYLLQLLTRMRTHLFLFETLQVVSILPIPTPFKKEEEKEEDMKSTNTIHLKMFKRDKKKNVSSFHYKSSKEMYFFHVIYVNSIGYKRGMCGRILEIFIIN